MVSIDVNFHKSHSISLNSSMLKLTNCNIFNRVRAFADDRAWVIFGVILRGLQPQNTSSLTSKRQIRTFVIIRSSRRVSIWHSVTPIFEHCRRVCSIFGETVCSVFKRWWRVCSIFGQTGRLISIFGHAGCVCPIFGHTGINWS